MNTRKYNNKAILPNNGESGILIDNSTNNTISIDSQNQADEIHDNPSPVKLKKNKTKVKRDKPYRVGDEKRRRIKKEDDENNDSNKNNICNWRFNKDKKIKNWVAYNETVLKNIIDVSHDTFDSTIHSSFDSDINLELMKLSIIKDLEQAETNKSAQPVKFSATGSPLEAKTPNGTQLTLAHHFGSFVVLNNNPTKKRLNFTELDSEKSPVIDENFLSSADYKKIKPPTKDKTTNSYIKVRKFNMTKESMAQGHKEHAKNGGKRICSQASKMINDGINEKEGKASLYANASGLFPDNTKHEWAHLEDYYHAVDKKKVQDENNLVATTFETNSCCMLVEDQTPYLAKEYKDKGGVDVISTGILFDKTQIAKKIDYTLAIGKTKKVKFPLTCAQTLEPPHSDYKTFIKSLSHAVVKTEKNLLISNTEESRITEAPQAKTPFQPTFFYSSNRKFDNIDMNEKRILLSKKR